MMKSKSLLILILSVFLLHPFAMNAQIVWYVNYAAGGNNNGTTPIDAFRSLDTAISIASDGDTIKVASGTYKPQQQLPGGSSNRDNAFYITKSIVLLGGYNPAFTEKNIYLNSTVLDGDIGVVGSSADNCFHVLIWNSPGKTGVIDGFTVQNGFADLATTVSGIARNHGGGAFVAAATTLVMTRMAFENNKATGNGGAIYNGAISNGSLTIEKSTFASNTGGLGGAIYSTVGANTAGFNRIVNTSFSKNTTTSGAGGAIYFSNNTANSSKIAFCTFNGNTASNNTGNAVYYAGVASKELKANIIYGNGSGKDKELSNASTSEYNITRDQVLSGTGNISIPDGNAANIFALLSEDGTAVLSYNGGATETMRPKKLGIAHNVVPSGSVLGIDTTTTDQCDSIRMVDGAAEIGAVEIQWKWPACTTNTTWYVDASSPYPDANGSLQFQPASDLSLVLANPCLKPGDTIKVAGRYNEEQIYRPSLSLPSGSSIRDWSFYVTKSITLLGGYDPSFSLRDYNTYKTVLDGDVGVVGNNTDNASHVMVWNTSDGQAGAIDGFIIRNGNANTAGTLIVLKNAGAGLYQNAGALTVSHIIFQNNIATGNGAGIYANAELKIAYSSFLNNTSSANGGALYRSISTGMLQITKSTFAANRAVLGGALYSDVSNAADLNYISNCTFSGNMATGADGGAALYFSKNVANISKITYSSFNANKSTTNKANAIFYVSAAAKELKGNIIYGNGTGIGTEITNTGAAAGIMYNIIREQSVTGAANINNQNVPSGRAVYIFATVVGDSAVLTDNGGFTSTLMLTQGGLAQGKIPALSIDTTTTDQRDAIRSGNLFSIGSVDLPVDCNPSKVWYVDAAASPGGTGKLPEDPINDLSVLLAYPCLRAGDTVKVAKGTYKPTIIPFDNTSSARDQSFLISMGIHLKGGYDADFKETTRDASGRSTILDGDLGVIGTLTDNAYHVMVWNAPDNQPGSIDGFTLQNGYGNSASSVNSILQNRGAGLHVAQGVLTFMNSIIQNNASTGLGAGIYTAPSATALSVIRSMINDNINSLAGAGIYAESLLNLHNTNIVNNKATTTGGAGVYAKDGLSLSGKIVIENNTATGGSGAGLYKLATGNLVADHLDSLIIRNNTFSSTTGSGGGCYLAANMDAPNLKYLNVSDNTAYTSGGGIYANANLNIPSADSIIISNNKAGYNASTTLFAGTNNHGAGIYSATSLTLSGKVVISNNITSGQGGGIHKVNAGVLDLTNVSALTVDANEARLGQAGGINNLMTGSTDLPNLKYLNISNNIAAGHGGGIYTTGSFNIPQADVLVLQNNKAGYSSGTYSATTYSGGAVYALAALNLSGDIRMKNNTVAGAGGTIYANGDLTLAGKVRMENNTANIFGGAIYKSATGSFITVQLDSLVAINNESKTSAGGAIYTASVLEMINPLGRFENNKAATDGGAVYANASFSVSDFKFINNTADKNGGAIFVNSPSSTTLNFIGYMYFENNTAGASGGAIYSAAPFAVASVDSILLLNNRATLSGGAIYSKTDILFYGLQKGFASGNTALQDGGAIYGEKSMFFKNFLFEHNQATRTGGALYGLEQLDIQASSFNGNTATNGGALYKGLSGTFTFNVSLSTFAANRATQLGGAIFSDFGTSSPVISNQQNFTNNTFSGNKAGSKGGAVYFGYTAGTAGSAAYANIIYCSFNSNSAGEGNALYYEKTVVNPNTLGTMFGNILCNGPSGTEINTSTPGLNAVNSQYNLIRNIDLPGTGNQNITNENIVDIFVSPVGDSAVLADNGGRTKTLLISQNGLAYNKIPQSLTLQYTTNDQRNENRIVNLSDIGSVELEDLSCVRSLEPLVWYVDIAAIDGAPGTLSTNPAKYLETVLNNPCLEDRDTIKIAAGTYALATSDPTQSFFVTKAVVIKGGYPTGDFSEANRNIKTNVTILDGRNISYHTVVWNTSDAYLGSIDGITIQNGKATGTVTASTLPQNKGGGVFTSLGKLALVGTTLRNNIAASSGGGIFSSENTVLTLRNTNSFSNKAGYNGTVFTTNAAGTSLSLQVEYSGGGVCALGQLILSGNLQFDGDEAGVNGGGILKGTFNTVDASSLDSLTLRNCVARVTSGGKGVRGDHGGGGIFVMGGLDLTSAKKLTVVNCSAPGAVFGEGGGIFINNKTGRFVSLKIANDYIVNCNCGDDGGGVESYGGTVSQIFLKDVYFRGCTAGRYGGAVGSGHALELQGKVVIDSCISGSNGGGISQWTSGGALLPIMFNNSSLDTLIITRCGTRASSATIGGGAIWVSNNDLDLSPVKYLYIADSYSGEMGGGIKMQAAKKLTLSPNAIFKNNRAGFNGTTTVVAKFGGAIYTAGALEMKGRLQFDGNTASASGGAVYVASAGTISASTLDTLLMRDNKALAGDGGGIYVAKMLDLSSIRYADISRNTATGNGGAIYANDVLTIANANIVENTAGNTGGAIWKSATGKLAIDKSLLAKNQAKSGGAVYSNIVTGKDVCLFFNSTLSQNKAIAGDGGAIYSAASATTPVSRMLFSTFNGNTATGAGNAIYYVNATGEVINGSVIYGNGTVDINNIAGLAADYNVFKQQISGTANKQVGANKADSIFHTISSGETALLEDHGGKTKTLALTIGGYAHNLIPFDIASNWINSYIGRYTDQRDSARFVGCKVDAGAYELQASEYDTARYLLKNTSLCGDALVDADSLIVYTRNIKDTLYYSDANYTVPLPMPTKGHSKIYVKFLSYTNCEFEDVINITFSSVVPVANITEKIKTVCPETAVSLTTRALSSVTYTWSNFEHYSSSYTGEHTNNLVFNAKAFNKDTSFYVYVTVSSGCGMAKDSSKITIKGTPVVNVSVPYNIISDACVAKPFELIVKTKNVSYYQFLPPGLNITGTDQNGSTVGSTNSSVKYDSAAFRLFYTPAVQDKGKTLTVTLNTTGYPACGYRQDTMKFLVLPEPTAAKLEVISQPATLQEICKDTVYVLKIKATNVGGLINNKLSLVDMGASGIIVDSAQYLYPVKLSPLASDWKSLGKKDSIVDPFERAVRYQYNNIPALKGNDSVLVRIYVHAGCGFKSNNAMKFKANVFDKCGTAVGIVDVISNPFKLVSGESNSYTFSNSFTPVVLNPKIKDSVQLRVKVIISGSYETDENHESIIADYPPYFIPDLTTFRRVYNADGNITVTPVPGGDFRYSITIPSGLKAKNGGGAFTDSVIFAVRCYTGNVPCGQLELWNQVFYNYETNACGNGLCEITDVRAQSIDIINVQRYAFEMADSKDGFTQLGKWCDTVTLKTITPFLANDSLNVSFYVDKNANSRYTPGVDSLVYTTYVRSGNGVAPNETFDVPFTNIPYKSGYQLIAYSPDSKLCDTLTIPITIISGPDTVCQGPATPAIFEAPRGMLNYSFDAISGATKVLDNTLPPNQVKIRFTSAGDKSIKATYRRVVYNEETHKNDTLQASNSTFHFYVNPLVTADSVTIVGGETQICTPAIVKLYAENLQYASAHQWNASTVVGSYTGQNTDTLTYNLNGRLSDTTIVVAYTAIGLTACGNWTDSLRLTLYQQLKQATPEFLDSTICKGTNIQLNIGLPSGGGSDTYTYQWQERNKLTPWRNSAGTYSGLSATDQYYLTEGLSDTTWFRRIATAKCAQDTSEVIKVNVRTTIAQLAIVKGKNNSLCSGAVVTMAITSENADSIVWTYLSAMGTRQELQPTDNIAGIGSTVMNSTRDTLIFTSLPQTSDVTARFEITAKDRCGDLKDTATVSLRAFSTGKIIKIQDTAVCFGTPFRFANVVTNSTYLGFDALRKEGFGEQNITSFDYVRDSVINTYTPIEAEANSTIKLKLSYRNNICTYRYDSIAIFVLPKVTAYNAAIITQPKTPQEVCTDTLYEVKIKALDHGSLKNINFVFNDNFDTRIQVKSFAYKYPYDAATWSHLPDSTVSGALTTWSIPDTVKGKDSLLVRVTVSPVCGFQSGYPILLNVNLTDICNHPMSGTTLTTQIFRTVQDNLMNASYKMLTSFNGAALNTSGNILINSHTNDTVTWRLAAIPTAGSVIDVDRQFMQVTLPLSLTPVDQSYTPIKNAPDYSKVEKYINEGNVVMRIPVVPELTVEDTTIVEFKFVAGRAPCNLYKNLLAETIFRDSVQCGNTVCPFFATLGSATPTVNVQRYAFALDTIKGYTRAGYWNAELRMKALNGFLAGDSLKIDFYVDKNNNNYYDPSDEPSVYTYYAKTATDISAGGILNVLLANVPATYGYQFIAYSKDPLLCAVTQFPVTIMTSDDDICTSDTTLIVFPEGMSEYHIDAISGATRIPLQGSNASNYPNENVRRIKWLNPQTIDTIAITGSYRRSFPNGETALSEKTTFIAKINNAITYEGLSVLNNTTGEICSPDVIKIQAKNVRYATGRRWTVDTGVGTLTNATTDTVTFALNRRALTDTTVWVVYTATAEGACKNLKDSISLTIYRALSQPAPDFVDSSVCKNTGIVITAGDPVGGGFDNASQYTYQWQSKTLTGTWQNIAILGNMENYTTPLLSDTTWFRRIVKAKCVEDTGAIVRVAVYPSLEVKSLTLAYPVCMGDHIRFQLQVKGGVKPYMYSFDGINYHKINNVDSITTSGYTACHFDTLLYAGNYTVNILDSSRCVPIPQAIVIAPNSPSAIVLPTGALFVKTVPSGNADGSDWDNAFDGKYLAWYLRNKAVANTKIYLAEGTYTPFLAACDDAGVARSYSFDVLRNGMSITGGFAATSTGTDLSIYAPNTYVTRLSGEIQFNAVNSDNSYHVMTIAQNVSAVIQGVYISDGYADGMGESNSEKGAGILCFGDATLVKINQTTLENNAAQKGSAIYSFANTITTLDSVTIQNNLPVGANPSGAVVLWGDALIAYSAVVNNAQNDGIVSGGGNMRVWNTTISNNGRHGIVTDNTVTGGADIDLSLVNTTIANNTGNGVISDNNDPLKTSWTFNNSLLLNNGTDMAHTGTVDTLMFRYMIVGNTKYITGGNDTKPLPQAVVLDALAYNDGFTVNHALFQACDNPAVQSGDVNILSDDMLKYDQRGVLRKSPPSIGAYDNDQAILITFNKPAKDTVCENTFYQIKSSVALPFNTTITGYQWYKDGVALTDSTNENLTLDSIKVSGKYTLLVTTNRLGCSRMSDTVDVFVREAPQVTITDNATICEGDQVTITITLTKGEKLPLWEVHYKIGNIEQPKVSNTSGTNIIQLTVSPEQSTIYSIVDVKDGNGCITTY